MLVVVRGGVLDGFGAGTVGYEHLIDWSMAHGHLPSFIIEGTGPTALGLTAEVRRHDIGVVLARIFRVILM